MARIVIQDSSTGEIKQISDVALPFFPGYVQVDTIDDEFPPTLFYTGAAADARYVNVAEISDPDSPGGVALRAASVAAVEDAEELAPAGQWDFTQPPTVGGAAFPFVPSGDLRAFGIYRPENYGAVGNGIANDTAAVQAAIDAASGGPAGAEPSPVRYAVGAVHLTGTYLTTAAPVAKAVVGLHILGLGPRRSRIKVSGTRTDGFSVIGCPGFVMQDVGIIGDGVAGTATVTNAGFAIDWTPTQTNSWGSFPTLKRVYVEELKFKHGFAFGAQSSSYDLSDINAEDLFVAGNRAHNSADTSLWQTGYLCGSGIGGNVLNHHFKHCAGYHLRRLYHVNNVNMVSIENGNGSFFEAALYRQGFGTTTYRDSRIEESQRLAMCPGGADYPVNLTMEDIVWSPGLSGSAAPDRMIVQWYAAGNVHFRQLVLEQDSSTSGWLFQFSTSGQVVRQVNVIVDGVVTTNATAESLFSIPANTKCYAEVRGLIQYNNAGPTGTYVGRKVMTYYGAAGDAGAVALP